MPSRRRPNSRTRQKRAASARAAPRVEELEREVDREEARTRQPSSADRDARPFWRRIVTTERRPPTRAERDETPWTRQGMLTLALIVAVLQLPFGILLYLQDKSTSFAAELVATMYPGQLPLPLAACFLLANPLARKLAEQPRNLRFLECLGVTAVVYMFTTFFWTAVLRGGSGDRQATPGLIAGLGAADVAALVLGSLAYLPISRRLSPQRRMKR